ncbi:MAG: aminodeoxychorismate/anthranilate synthase component II [Fimbriimonadaceae bacterium]
MFVILVIDNFDSFTYNLVQYLGQCGAEVVVKRNNEIDLNGIVDLDPAGIMLSPGPCSPQQSGICLDIARIALAEEAAPVFRRPLFGVCLGHQAIGEVAGGTVRRAGNIMHGKASMVEHDGFGLFVNMPNPFRAIRYHSLIVQEAGLPNDFKVTARSKDDNEIMGIRHNSRAIESLQFHPESVLTENGIEIIRNFVNWVGIQ